MIRAFINKKNIESILLNENTCQIKTSIKRFQGSADSLVSTKRLHIKLGLLKYVWTPSTKESKILTLMLWQYHIYFLTQSNHIEEFR